MTDPDDEGRAGSPHESSDPQVDPLPPKWGGADYLSRHPGADVVVHDEQVTDRVVMHTVDGADGPTAGQLVDELLLVLGTQVPRLVTAATERPDTLLVAFGGRGFRVTVEPSELGHA